LISVSEPVFDDDLQSIIGFEVKRIPAIPAATVIRHPVQPQQRRDRSSPAALSRHRDERA
jgi:hypothetical protein